MTLYTFLIGDLLVTLEVKELTSICLLYEGICYNFFFSVEKGE